MPTAPSLARPSARSRATNLRAAAAIAVAVAATVALLAATSSILAGPERVDFAVENPTSYPLLLEVRKAAGGSVYKLGPISQGGTREFTGVIDQGDTWLFTYTYGGVLAAEVSVERSELESGPVSVPDSAERVLRESDLPPPPAG